jgi:hypothetical protein
MYTCNPTARLASVISFHFKYTPFEKRDESTSLRGFHLIEFIPIKFLMLSCHMDLFREKISMLGFGCHFDVKS